MLEIPEFLQKGHKVNIGSHLFTTEEIIRYGKSYAPFDFHTDSEKAKTSPYGGLIANGFHVSSVWMSMQRTFVEETTQRLKDKNKTFPVFGPSPGIRYMNWPNPVFAGDTVHYENHIQDIRASKSRPDWWVMTNRVTGLNPSGKTVMEFESSAFITLKKAS